jgi:NitT/TauT family transport system substrate-binding protein
MRKQITFDEVNIHHVKKEINIFEIFDDENIYGVVTVNPYKEMLIQENKAHLLFDSRQIPNEIMDMIIVRRDILLEYPNFAQALIATWFLIMERLQGNNRAATIDSMAKLMNISRDEYTSQIQEIILNDSPTKALSAIRDRGIRKTMRFIRHFTERYGLTGDEPYDRWVSYPGRAPELIHFNAAPLQNFIAPIKEYND